MPFFSCCSVLFFRKSIVLRGFLLNELRSPTTGLFLICFCRYTLLSRIFIVWRSCQVSSLVHPRENNSHCFRLLVKSIRDFCEHRLQDSKIPAVCWIELPVSIEGCDLFSPVYDSPSSELSLNKFALCDFMNHNFFFFEENIFFFFFMVETHWDTCSLRWRKSFS